MQAPVKTNVSEILRSMTPNLFDHTNPENHKADHNVWNRVARI